MRTSLFWSAMERVGLMSGQFLLGIFLARLLSPKEYGLVGMLVIFSGLGQVFSNAGLSTALVRRPVNSSDDEATVFYWNVCAGAAVTLLICAVSPLVAKFYRQPTLMPLLSVLSIQVFLSSFGIVSSALMARAMDFRRLAIVGMLSMLFSGLVGIGMAWNGMGAWSLVGQSVTGALFGSLLVWKLGKWRLSGHFSRASLREMWPFSSRLLTSALLDTIFENLYNIAIGRLYMPDELGFFTRARNLAQSPAGVIIAIFSQATLPAFSRIQNDTEILRASVRKVFRLMAAIHFPIMMGLAVIANPLVRCLLTDKWTPCVPYLQVLAFSGMLYPVHALHLNVLIAQGRSDFFLRLEVIKKIMIILTLLSTLHLGVSGIVLGIFILSVSCLAINGHYSHKILNYRWYEQASDLIPILGASMVMAMAMLAIHLLKFGGNRMGFGWLTFQNPRALLLVQVAVGITIYGVIVGLSPFISYAEFRSHICSYFELEITRHGRGSA